MAQTIKKNPTHQASYPGDTNQDGRLSADEALAELGKDGNNPTHALFDAVATLTRCVEYVTMDHMVKSSPHATPQHTQALKSLAAGHQREMQSDLDHFFKTHVKDSTKTPVVKPYLTLPKGVEVPPLDQLCAKTIIAIVPLEPLPPPETPPTQPKRLLDL